MCNSLEARTAPDTDPVTPRDDGGRSICARIGRIATFAGVEACFLLTVILRMIIVDVLASLRMYLVELKQLVPSLNRRCTRVCLLLLRLVSVTWCE